MKLEVGKIYINTLNDTVYKVVKINKDSVEFILSPGEMFPPRTTWSLKNNFSYFEEIIDLKKIIAEGLNRDDK